MRLVSWRYVLPLAGLLAVAVAASVVLRVQPRWSDPCRNPEALRATSMIPGTVPAGERLEDRSPNMIQWSEGQIRDPDEGSNLLEYQLIRGYWMAQIVVRPESFVNRAMDPDEHEVHVVETAAGRLPVHVVWDRVLGVVAAYAIVVGLEPSAHPFLAKLADAPREALVGARPVTLLIVSGEVPDGQATQAKERARRWIEEAWIYFDRVCAGDSAGTTKSAHIRRSATGARSSIELNNSTRWLDFEGALQAVARHVSWRGAERGNGAAHAARRRPRDPTVALLSHRETRQYHRRGGA